MSLVTVVEYNKTSVKRRRERCSSYILPWNGIEQKRRESKGKEWNGIEAKRKQVERHGVRLRQRVAIVHRNERDENIREHTKRKRK